LVNDGLYQVLTNVEAVETATAEQFTDDNVGTALVNHPYKSAAGTVTSNNLTRFGVVLPLNDGVSLRVAGPGMAEVTRGENGAADITLRNTSFGTAVAPVIARGASLIVDDLQAFSPVGTIAFGAVAVQGSVSLTQGVLNFAAGTLDPRAGLDDAQIFIGRTANVGVSANLAFGAVSDYNLLSYQRVNNLRALSWLNTGGAENTIQTEGLRTLTVLGDLSANVDVTAPGAVASVRVTGDFKDSFLRTVGNLTTAVFGSMTRSEVLVGVRNTLDTLSEIGPPQILNSMVVTGTFSASNISAAQINNLVLRSVNGDGTSDFGVHVDVIRSYLRGTVRLVNLANPFIDTNGEQAPNAYDEVGRYRLTVL
jgi:hypothetical protein